MYRTEKKTGLNLEDVQEYNRALIIRVLRKKRTCSRADLAKATGLKNATVTNIVNDLIGWGLVSETGLLTSKKGRRSIGISLDTEQYRVIGVRLSRQYFEIGLFDLLGSGTNIILEPIDSFEESTSVLSKIKAAINRLIASSEKYKILGIGVAIPGPYFRTEGRIALMTEFPGWEKIAIENDFKSSFPVPVYFEHDANAGAVAEWLLGPHSRESGTMLYVAAGQGIGAGIVIDGKLFRGTLGIAGEIGHMSIAFEGPKCECGNNGCLEHYCSTIALGREIKIQLLEKHSSKLKEDCPTKAIIEAAEAGDEIAVRAIKKVAWYLGFGLASVVNAYNPDIIIIGDELAQDKKYLLETIKSTIASHVLPSVYAGLKIELSSFTTDPVLIGVSSIAVEKILHRPSLIPQLAKTHQSEEVMTDTIYS